MRRGHGAWLLASAALLAAAALGCNQPNDVVAQVSALHDAGSSGAPAPPPPPPETPIADAGPSCMAAPDFVLLSSVARNGCLAPEGVRPLATLARFFFYQPRPMPPAEALQITTCDLYRDLEPPFWLYEPVPGSGEFKVCPAYCELLQDYVDTEEQRLLACQGLGTE